MEALQRIEDWPAPTAAAGVVQNAEVVAVRGPHDRMFRWASVTKLVTALAALVAAEEGVVDLDEQAGATGFTVRHLPAHASGLTFEPGAPARRAGQPPADSDLGLQ